MRICKYPRYQVSGILILPGEPLANGYCKWHPEKGGRGVGVGGGAW